MATLEELLTFNEGDPDAGQIRAQLRDTMRNTRWEILYQRGELAFWQHSVDTATGEGMQAEGKARVLAVTQSLNNLVAKYNAFADQLAAMPPEQG